MNGFPLRISVEVPSAPASRRYLMAMLDVAAGSGVCYSFTDMVQTPVGVVTIPEPMDRDALFDTVERVLSEEIGERALVHR